MNDSGLMLDGRRVRRVRVPVTPEVAVDVYEAANADEALAAAIAASGDAYAAILWPGAIAAAAHVARCVVPGSVVVDVGAGTGLVALAAARVGARAIALEHDAFARNVITYAADVQRLAVDVRDFDFMSRATLPPADVFVLSDLLYEPALAVAAARRAVEGVRTGGVVIVTDPGRNGRAAFEREVREAGVVVEFGDIVTDVPGELQRARVGLAVLRA